MPDYYIGKDLTGLTIAGGTRDATTGVITYGTPIDITNYVDMVSINATNLTEVIMPVNAGKVHNEPTVTDSGMSIVQIKRRLGGTAVSTLSFGFSYARAVYTERNGDQYQMTGVIGTLDDGTRAIGKNVAGFNLLQTLEGGLVKL